MINYYSLGPNGELYHHGVKGMHWGERRYQNEDGSLTALGRERYGEESSDGLSAARSIAERVKSMGSSKSLYEDYLYRSVEKNEDERGYNKRVANHYRNRYDDDWRDEFRNKTMQKSLEKFEQAFSTIPMSQVQSKDYSLAKDYLGKAIDTARNIGVPSKELYDAGYQASIYLDRFMYSFDK